MPLFPKEESDGVADAPQRMWWTREKGTSRLVGGFIALIILWFVIWWIRDFFLLRAKWPAHQADQDGLTVVGTLDSRESFDRNLIRIVQAEGQSRAELTSWGWDSIFDEANGKLCGDREATTIKGVIDIDSAIGYALLEPYLKAAVKREMRVPNAFEMVTAEYPITFTEKVEKPDFPKRRELGVLLDYYNQQGLKTTQAETKESDGGGSGEHEVDHGVSIPGELLIRTCPVVLVGSDFTGGWVQENPANILVGKTYTIHLDLSPEGRSRFYQWSRFHAHESLVFVLKREVITAARIAQTMDERELDITNVKDAEAANALVNYVKQQATQEPGRNAVQPPPSMRW